MRPPFPPFVSFVSFVVKIFVSALLLPLLSWSASARADLTLTRVFTVNQLVPDFGELADARTLSLGGGIVTDVNVALSLDSSPDHDPAWAGDYYVTLGHGSGLAVLLNRIGRTDTDAFGSSSGGLSVTLDDDAPVGDIHAAPHDPEPLSPPPLAGAWAPDARNVDPALVTAASPRTAFLSVFNGGPTDGEWRLFVADESPGGVARLSSWSLSLTFTPSDSALHLTPADTLTVATPQTFAPALINHGLVIAPSAPDHALTLTGPLSGPGHFQGNLILQNSYSPGDGPAAITFDGDLLFGPGHVLTLEIGGAAPGTDHDTLAITGSLTLGGTLNVVFLNGFVPAPTDFFQFFTASSFGGSFAQINLPAGFTPTGNLANGDGFTLTAIPEPAACATLAALAALGLAARRRRRA